MHVLTTLADEAGIARASAATWIHCRDQHEAGGIGDAMVGTRDRHFAGFERLSQRVEDLTREFRQLVEEENTVVRK